MARGNYATGDVPIVRVPVTAGSFVTCRQIGGFTDSATGIHFPGPKATIDSVTRQVIALHDFPPPIQLPTTKMSPNPKDLSEYLEVDFFENDSITDSAIRLALDVGILEIVEDDVVEAAYPDVWRTRRAWCYEPRSNVRDAVKSESLADLYERARDEHLSKAREANRKTDADARNAAAAK